MEKSEFKTQRITTKEDCIGNVIAAFLIDRKSSNLTGRSIHFYECKLKLFTGFCKDKIEEVRQVTPDLLRRYFIYLEEDHNKGGVHACYRALRALLLWYEQEYEPEGWKNPVLKIKPPKQAKELLKPVELSDVRKLIEACKDDFYGIRDKAIFYFLLDTGLRAAELLSLNMEDITADGVVNVKHGKGDKARVVFLNKRSRRYFNAYLKLRKDDNEAVWVSPRTGMERLTYDGLRMIMKTRSVKANIPEVTCHEFRRAFAINMLRNGADVFTLQKLMGHASLTVLRRYLNQTELDVRVVHRRTSPADNM